MAIFNSYVSLPEGKKSDVYEVSILSILTWLDFDLTLAWLWLDFEAGLLKPYSADFCKFPIFHLSLGMWLNFNLRRIWGSSGPMEENTRANGARRGNAMVIWSEDVDFWRLGYLGFHGSGYTLW